MKTPSQKGCYNHWKCIFVDIIGLYKLKGNNNNISCKFFIIVDPPMGTLKIDDIPTVVSMDEKDTTNKVFDETLHN